MTQAPLPSEPPTTRSNLIEIALLFLKLGTFGFGGPAAHIALFEDEVVVRRRWISRQYLLDLLGAVNLIPGPNSTELAIHIGYVRGGWPGLIVGGLGFILPAVLVSGVLAWFYVRFGDLPAVAPFLFGIKPAVLAIITLAVWRLGRGLLRNWRLAIVGAAVAGAVLLGADEVLALLGGGIAGMIWLRTHQGAGRGVIALLLITPLAIRTTPAASAAGWLGLSAEVPLTQLGLFFLKIGSIMYGSGYVLFAFLEGAIVRDYGWLTQTQLLDAIAIGQFTPGPLLSSVTFVGYLVRGPAGAVVSTVAVFLPSFILVLGLHRVLPYVRRSPWSAAFLDAVNVSAVALMAVVALRLGFATLQSWPAALIAGLALVVLLWKRPGAVWLVLGGALLGWLLQAWV